MIAEIARVLSPNGKFLLTDALWRDDRRVGKLIWKYDRGSHPRTPEKLRATVAAHLTIEQWTQFAVWHEYFLCVAKK
jgi:hypothetical protein